jgi:ethanolamine ammonia-lyase large subunit
MLHRRRFLETGIGCAAMASWPRIGSSHVPSDSPWPEARPGEDVISWIERTHGKWSDDLYRNVLGAANEFKEGDAILGIAARDVAERSQARELLGNTTLRQIDAHPPFADDMLTWIQRWVDAKVARKHQDMTLAELKAFLLNRNPADIHELRVGLSSDVIACVIKLMSNDELIRIGAKVFNSLPGSNLGSPGYMGARIQPNSPTDDPEDIRWQVFDAFAYAVGDVLIGTNPVSSEPASVASVEETLREILDTFGLTGILPHCVLSHIDVQAEVEREQPGSTALWFQSIAGSDAANGTFDVTLEKMIRHAESRRGPFGLYFETGQGADFTNGHGFGTDMVVHESRKYGLARALSRVVAETRQRSQLGADAWVHVNDVAGFIGPEVFRTKEQLVRCCLEDIVMGKLHGLMIGLDVCTTLHMDVSLDDLGWCIDQIMPANPGYLMALPTRIDPMLGYLTTGYQDHVHIRKKFGYKVDDRMWSFFQSLGIIDEDGQPTDRFGDPSWVYVQYCRRKGDNRSRDAILAEAQEQMERVRERGVFLATHYGAEPEQLDTQLDQQIHGIYRDAKECIWAEWPNDFEKQWPNGIPLQTRSNHREDYILHPASGELLSVDAIERIKQLQQDELGECDTVIVLSDGLNALAHTTQSQSQRLVDRLRSELKRAGFQVHPKTLIVRSSRVRAGYCIGEHLFQSREGRFQIVHVIGERPGSGHRTLSIYLTSADGVKWSIPSAVDHNITKVVSGIAVTALLPEVAAETAARLLRAMT